MYRRQFALTRFPFESTLEADELFASATIGEAQVRASTSVPGGFVEPPAVEALFQATHGLPRKVNRLAHYALSVAAIDKARAVTPEHVQAAREEVSP